MISLIVRVILQLVSGLAQLAITLGALFGALLAALVRFAGQQWQQRRSAPASPPPAGPAVGVSPRGHKAPQLLRLKPWGNDAVPPR